MSTKPASLADSRRDNEDSVPSASARFRLKMTPTGELVPQIIPVEDNATTKPKG